MTRGDEEVGLDAEQFWCDAAAFDALLDAGREGACLELYQGRLPGRLPCSGLHRTSWIGSSGSGSVSRRKLSEAAESLSEDQEKAGKVTAAASWARRALELSPQNERCCSRLVRLLDQAGRQAEALDAFDSLRCRPGRRVRVGASRRRPALGGRGAEDMGGRRPATGPSGDRAIPAEPSPEPSLQVPRTTSRNGTRPSSSAVRRKGTLSSPRSRPTA